jgi:hypothetical protein
MLAFRQVISTAAVVDRPNPPERVSLRKLSLIARSTMRRASIVVALATVPLLTGCGADESDPASAPDPVLTDATSLECPAPGNLPFALESSGFASGDARAVVEDNPRNKDEAADILGNPGGVFGYTNMPVSDALVGGPLVFAGKKARAPQGAGLNSTPIGGEAVSLWHYDVAGESWNQLDRGTTDAFGAYRFDNAVAIDDPGVPVYSMLEADGSCAAHYGFVLDAGAKVVITDIDGTLTLSDDELLMQIDDGDYVPAEKIAAAQLMNTWADKGYDVVYMTARPHAFRSETRAWLDDLGYPLGPVISANSLVFGDTAREYKSAWVNRVVNDLGWVVVAAYGNATSDIDAYADAGIPQDITFIIGENAGVSGTVAVDNDDYSAHIADFVETQPDA